MNIKEQFNFVAQEYDNNRKKFIPCFDDYYENTTKFILRVSTRLSLNPYGRDPVRR